jgi:hypothetical protein
MEVTFPMGENSPGFHEYPWDLVLETKAVISFPIKHILEFVQMSMCLSVKIKAYNSA